MITDIKDVTRIVGVPNSGREAGNLLRRNDYATM